MEREQAKEYIHSNPEIYLRRDKSGKGYICPLCGSGTGKNGTGLTSKNGIHFTCWRGCFQAVDVIDIIGMEYGLIKPADKFQKAYDIYGIKLDNTLQRAQKNIGNTDYPARRGISAETCRRFQLGYVEKWRSPKAVSDGKNPPYSPRLIIPTGSGSYVARDVREKLTEQEKKYSKVKQGKSRIFNMQALFAAKQPIFVVEGEMDALSIEEVGGTAIGLGSVGNIQQLLRLLDQKKPSQPLLLCMDNDEAGQKAAQRLSEGLDERNIVYFPMELPPAYKDANEALLDDRVSFATWVQDAESIEEEAKEAEKQEYLQNSCLHYIKGFMGEIAASINTEAFSTGFPSLDAALDGGLYEGLYVLGAISSLGKTTLLLQICDQIAQNGQDVLLFSLEMARYEIMAKSISRHTVQEALRRGGDTRVAKTARGITSGKRYAGYSETERLLIASAVDAYAAYAGRVFISEGVGDIGVMEVRETVARHMHCTGRTPVVVVDYLQILTPLNERATDKQNMDRSIMELKRISRDYKIPVLGISSFNRANYAQSVTMEAFKESGAIEYSSDVLIGLQLRGAGRKDFDAGAEKSKNPRQIEMAILKNRNGRAGVILDFQYYPLFNFFEEI